MNDIKKVVDGNKRIIAPSPSCGHASYVGTKKTSGSPCRKDFQTPLALVVQARSYNLICEEAIKFGIQGGSVGWRSIVGELYPRFYGCYEYSRLTRKTSTLYKGTCINCGDSIDFYDSVQFFYVIPLLY